MGSCRNVHLERCPFVTEIHGPRGHGQQLDGGCWDLSVQNAVLEKLEKEAELSVLSTKAWGSSDV